MQREVRQASNRFDPVIDRKQTLELQYRRAGICLFETQKFEDDQTWEAHEPIVDLECLSDFNRSVKKLLFACPECGR